MKIYCYVTTETCRIMRTAKPGAEVDGRRVSKHGDYTAWGYCKRATQHMVGHAGGWRGAAAVAVCREMGWQL